jgi:hypothetical protein
MGVLESIRPLVAALLLRLRALHEDQRGYSTEAVIVTAALAALAIAAAAIITIKVLAQANAVQTH